MTPQQIAKTIDHTLLKADAREHDIARLCKEAVEHGFYSVCVNSRHIAFCANELKGTEVKIASVVGFPLGAMDSKAKAYETERALFLGASEIDMVLDIGALKDKQNSLVEADIRGVVLAAGKAPVK